MTTAITTEPTSSRSTTQTEPRYALRRIVRPEVLLPVLRPYFFPEGKHPTDEEFEAMPECYAVYDNVDLALAGAIWHDGDWLHAAFLNGLVGKAAVLREAWGRMEPRWLGVPERLPAVVRWLERHVGFREVYREDGWTMMWRTSPCIEYEGPKDRDGYGLVWVKVDGRKTTRRAHRLAWEREVGAIPAGLQIDHLCRNRACVKVEHMQVVTCRENLMRGQTLAAENAAKTHCPKGHPYDSENTAVYGRRRYCRTCQRAKSLRYQRQKKRQLGVWLSTVRRREQRQRKRGQ